LIELNKIYQGDCLEVMKTFPDELVQCVVTSPPYWGLRDYGVNGQLGLEKTPGLYVEKLVEIFREVRRVLRKDGTVWLNLGDSYTSDGLKRMSVKLGSGIQANQRAKNNDYEKVTASRGARYYRNINLKQKDIIGIPWHVAFALQADGWWLRSPIIWSKPNPMPESVTDRPTNSHEYIFLLTKNRFYYYDQDAIREDYKMNRWGGKYKTNEDSVKIKPGDYRAGGQGQLNRMNYDCYSHEGRNIRSVWEIPTEPFPGAHFATYPRKLVSQCLKAGTSEYGACAECEGPWERVVEVENITRTRKTGKGQDTEIGRKGRAGEPNRKTTGWQPTCNCDTKEIKPCVVLDPFIGSGTTAEVAQRMIRRWIGIELSDEYIKIAEKRLVQNTLF